MSYFLKFLIYIQIPTSNLIFPFSIKMIWILIAITNFYATYSNMSSKNNNDEGNLSKRFMNCGNIISIFVGNKDNWNSNNESNIGSNNIINYILLKRFLYLKVFYIS